jgi:hypothetical protein
MLDSYVADKNVIVAERVEPKRENVYCVNEIEKVVENLKLIFKRVFSGWLEKHDQCGFRTNFTHTTIFST